MKIINFLKFSKKYFHPKKLFLLFIKHYNQSPKTILKKFFALYRFHNSQSETFMEYSQWINTNYPSKKELKEQRETSKKFSQRPLISIIMPTFNTEIQFLTEAINSVLNQTYDNWELCIADDASTNQKVINLIRKYQKKDKRIKYTIRKKNGHICKASNSALKLAAGKYISLLDHDDVLWPNALFEIVTVINKYPNTKFIYSDEDKILEDGKTHVDPFFKPDWSPDYLRSLNYITHFTTIKKTEIDKVEGFKVGTEGAQDWSLFLRVTRNLDKTANYNNHPYTDDNQIIHIPKILYSWRISNHSTASSEHAEKAKSYAYINQKSILNNDLKSRGIKGNVLKTEYLGCWNIKYAPKQEQISIIIPTKDKYNYISKCINSIYSKSTYSMFEVIIVDTGSTDDLVLKLYEEYKSSHTNFRVIKWNKEFNFSEVCNYGVSKANGEYLLFLNNDTEVLSSDWLERMLGLAQQEHVGAVSGKLLYPNHKIQHLGGLLGITGDPKELGIAGHAYRGSKELFRHFDRLAIKNYSFVTGACLMINLNKFKKIGGFDPEFKIAFNDIDFCLRLNKLGYFHAVDPYVELLHKESASLKSPGEDGRDLTVWKKEIALFLEKWDNYREKDPFYNFNLSLNREDFQGFRK